jgi:hypothetical protein
MSWCSTSVLSTLAKLWDNLFQLDTLVDNNLQQGQQDVNGDEGAVLSTLADDVRVLRTRPVAFQGQDVAWNKDIFQGSSL